MGLIGQVFSLLFGGGGNVIRDTAEVFRENAEGASQRAAAMRGAALAQFAAEFAHPRQGVFDRALDAINRLPRPALAIGTLALFVSAMVDPVWFAARMTGIALVPEPLWWLLGRDRVVLLRRAASGEVAPVPALACANHGPRPRHRPRDRGARGRNRPPRCAKPCVGRMEGGPGMSDAIFRILADDGPWVLLVFYLLYRDFEKDKATRTVIDKNAHVLTEIATIVRERLPGPGR